MDKEIIIALISTVGAVSIAYITNVLAKFYTKNKDPKHIVEKLTEAEVSYAKHLAPLGQGLAIIERQAKDPDSGIDRAIMFEGHDDGGPPNPKTPYYVDVIYPQVMPDPTDKYLTEADLRKKYSNLQVDSYYVNMLSELITTKDTILIPSEMENCLLKEIYISEKVTWSLVSYLGLHGESIIFMSQSTHGELPTSEQILNARLAANHLRSIMR